MAGASELAVLPDLVGQIVRDLRKAQARLVLESVLPLRDFPAAFPAFYALGAVELDLQLFFTRTESKTIFFFWRETVERPLLQASLKLRFSAQFPDEVSTLPAAVSRFVPPDFLIWEPTESEIRFLVGAEADPSNIMILHSGEGWLAVDLEEKALFHAGPDRLAERLAEGPLGFDARPLHGAFQAMRRWMERRDWARAGSQLLDPGLGAPDSSLREVVEVLERINALSSQDTELSLLSIGLDEFEASTLLRLTDDGELDVEGDDDAHEVGLRLRRVPDGRSPELYFSLTPPGFLLQGSGLEQLGAALEEDEALEDLLDELALEIELEELRDAVTRGINGSDAFAFRTKKKSDEEKWIVSFDLLLGAKATRLYLSIEVELEEGRTTPTYGGDLEELGRGDFASKELVEKFIRLARDLDFWARLVKDGLT